MNHAFRLTSAHTGESTATHGPSNPEMATTPAHFPSGDDNHSIIFLEDGSFGMMPSDEVEDFWSLAVPQIVAGMDDNWQSGSWCESSRDT